MIKSSLVGLDTNVLVYADDSSNPFFLKAAALLENILLGKIKGVLSPQIFAEYYAVVTSSHKVRNPLSESEARERIFFLHQSKKLKKIFPKRTTLIQGVDFCAKNKIHGAHIFDAFYAMTLIDNRVFRIFTHNKKDFLIFEKLGMSVEDPF